MGGLRRRLLRLTSSRIAVSTGVIMVGNGLRLLIALLTFAIVARSLGAAQFGAFTTVVAIVGVVGTFAGWGGPTLALRRIARSPAEFSEALGTAFVYLAVTAPVLFVVSLVLNVLIMHGSVSMMMIVFISIADLVFQPINVTAVACLQGLNRPVSTAWLSIVFSLARAVAAVIWILVSAQHDVLSWSLFYLCGSVVASGMSLHQVLRAGRPRWKVKWSEWGDGFHFALLATSETVFREADKPVIASLSSLSTVGIYAAALRLADAAAMPVRALNFSTFGRFFEVGAHGLDRSLKFALRILPLSLGISVIPGVAIVLVAPYVTLLLGHAYANTRETLMILAVYPALVALRCLAGDVLMTSDYVWARTLVQFVLPVVDIAFCWVLVPRYGPVGAAISTVLAHTTIAAVSWITVFVILRRTAQPGAKKLPEPTA